MQWIGDTIESPATGSFDTGLEQGSIGGGNDAASFGYDLLLALQAIRGGDFSVRLASDHDGLACKIAEAVNAVAAANQRLAKQLEHVGEEVGREATGRERVAFDLSNGAWGEMEDSIDKLRRATDHNIEQDWLKTNLARLTCMLQGSRDLSTLARLLLSELTPLANAQLGAIYRIESEQGAPYLRVLAAHADDDGRLYCDRIPLGAGPIGQCAIDRRRLLITEISTCAAPIGFSMFKAMPQNVIVLPILFDNQVKAVIELASVSAFTRLQMSLLEQVTVNVGIVFNSIETTMQTESLLKRLEDSENRRDLALAAGKMGSWDWDLADGRCVWDEGQRQIFGVDGASFEVVFSKVRELVDRGDWKMLCRLFKSARQKGGAYQIEFRVRRPDGGIRWCLGRAAASQDAGGRISRIRGVTMDITERKEAEERQSLLAREVDHRTKNVLAVVHAIVSLTRAEDIKQFSAAVEGRIQALARAHSLLSDSRWCGAKIADLIHGELASYRTPNLDRVRISGKSLSLHPSAVQALALAVHELTANAATHGALSVPSGSVQVTWESRDDQLELRWIERGGPPLEPKAPLGFGMRVIKASVETQLSGTVEFEWGYDGLQCVMCVPSRPKTELFDNFWDSIHDSGVRHSDARELGPRTRNPLVNNDGVHRHDPESKLGKLAFGAVGTIAI